MLLVDDDQPELGKRQEQRRTGADDDPRPTGDDRPPGVAALRLADVGMPLRGQRAEALAEALEPLRPEGDLGQQDQHLPPGGECCGECREIGLGLAGAGDAVEHGHAEAAGCDAVDQPARGDRLVGGERGTRQAPVGRRGEGRLGRCEAFLDEAAGDKRADDAGSAPGCSGELGRRKRHPVAQCLEHPLSRRCQPFFRDRAA